MNGTTAYSVTGSGTDQAQSQGSSPRAEESRVCRKESACRGNLLLLHIQACPEEFLDAGMLLSGAGDARMRRTLSFFDLYLIEAQIY
jgi:hypothetical protein